MQTQTYVNTWASIRHYYLTRTAVAIGNRRTWTSQLRAIRQELVVREDSLKSSTRTRAQSFRSTGIGVQSTRGGKHHGPRYSSTQ